MVEIFQGLAFTCRVKAIKNPTASFKECYLTRHIFSCGHLGLDRQAYAGRIFELGVLLLEFIDAPCYLVGLFVLREGS